MKCKKCGVECNGDYCRKHDPNQTKLFDTTQELRKVNYNLDVCVVDGSN